MKKKITLVHICVYSSKSKHDCGHKHDIFLTLKLIIVFEEKSYSCYFQVTDAAVMVWIHGGGFSSGSGSQDEYNGVPLSAVGEIIHVNIHYRVGTFGYLCTGKKGRNKKETYLFFYL